MKYFKKSLPNTYHHTFIRPTVENKLQKQQGGRDKENSHTYANPPADLKLYSNTRWQENSF